MLRTGACHPDAAAPTAAAAQADDDLRSPKEEGARLQGTLSEYLQLEQKYQPRLYLPQDHENEVSRDARDGAAQIMRCLKVWYELPPEVLMHAINLFDRFLTKMKVRHSHVPCITVACMYLAIDHHALINQRARRVFIEELVLITQSACTARDAARMSLVVADKLSVAGGGIGGAVTSLEWARLFAAVVRRAARTLQLPDKLTDFPESELVNMVEIAACDADCANARPSEIALVLLCHKLEGQFGEWSRSTQPWPKDACWLFDVIAQLQAACQMSEGSLSAVQALVSRVLSRYERSGAAPHRQRLVWRLSERTLKVLRPTDRLTSLLPTIEEQQHLAGDASPQRVRRSGSVNSDSSKLVTRASDADLLRPLIGLSDAHPPLPPLPVFPTPVRARPIASFGVSDVTKWRPRLMKLSEPL